MAPSRASSLANTGAISSACRSHPSATVQSALLRAIALVAATIAANGPLAVAATKAVARGSGDWSFAEGWAQQAELIAPVFASEDAREGATAFAEKRAPVWKGR